MLRFWEVFNGIYPLTLRASFMARILARHFVIVWQAVVIYFGSGRRCHYSDSTAAPAPAPDMAGAAAGRYIPTGQRPRRPTEARVIAPGVPFRLLWRPAGIGATFLDQVHTHNGRPLDRGCPRSGWWDVPRRGLFVVVRVPGPGSGPGTGWSHLKSGLSRDLPRLR